MLSDRRRVLTPAASSFLATCSAFSRRPACLALSRPMSSLLTSGGEPPCKPLRPAPAFLPPPVAPLGSALFSALSWPGSYFSLPTRAGVGRPLRFLAVSPTIWPGDLPRRPSPDRPLSSWLFGR